jgi:hypothetical protein
MKPASLLILALPLAVHGAEVYRSIESDGRVTFGDTPCPTGEVYRESVQAPCHRMIHARRPWLPLDALRSILA